jgi:hypothetical protein
MAEEHPLERLLRDAKEKDDRKAARADEIVALRKSAAACQLLTYATQ